VADFLYSTNTFLKYRIIENYRGRVHHVWASEHCDPKHAPSYSEASLVPPSSSPAEIYRELKRDVTAQDFHSAKITAQRVSLKRLAIKWEKTGEITKEEKTDIIYRVDHAPFEQWRPLLFVIPRGPVEHRLRLVPIKERAGFGPEYIIPDLIKSEFAIVEI
jgi:hypothetical protein